MQIEIETIEEKIANQEAEKLREEWEKKIEPIKALFYEELERFGCSNLLFMRRRYTGDFYPATIDGIFVAFMEHYVKKNLPKRVNEAIDKIIKKAQ